MRWKQFFTPVKSFDAADAKNYMNRTAADAFTLLDVRSKEEFESGHLRTAVHVYVGDLPSKLEQIPKRRPINTFCESGQRAAIAAAFLKRQGMEPVEVCLGSISACSHVECQVITGD